MRISLFGNLRIDFAGRTVTAINTNRLQSLISFLILHADIPQPRERIVHRRYFRAPADCIGNEDRVLRCDVI
jgi:hypothetical protein